MSNAKRTVRQPEILAPAGSYEKAIVAMLYGADAIYAGLPDLSLRDQAKNLNTEEIAALSFLSRKLNKKLYVTVNIFARQKHLQLLPEILEYLAGLNVDALIISDPGVIRLARKYAPNVPIHLSTQANTTNLESIMFWKEIGVRRINLARELSYEEAKEICSQSPLEIEMFVHGAMCISYSGRCLLSSIMTGRSANLGKCTHPCRWSYRIVEDTRPDDYFTVETYDDSSYIFNSRDLCLLKKLGDIIQLPVDSLKIEGRVKSFLYVATVTSVYKRAVKAFIEGQPDEKDLDRWMSELRMVSHRPYTLGPLFSELDETEPKSRYERTHALAGLVIPPPEPELNLPPKDDIVYLQVRRTLDLGNHLTFLNPDGSSYSIVLNHMETTTGQKISRAHPGMIIRIPIDFPAFAYQVVRVKLSENEP